MTQRYDQIVKTFESSLDDMPDVDIVTVDDNPDEYLVMLFLDRYIHPEYHDWFLMTDAEIKDIIDRLTQAREWIAARKNEQLWGGHVPPPAGYEEPF